MIRSYAVQIKVGWADVRKPIVGGLSVSHNSCKFNLLCEQVPLNSFDGLPYVSPSYFYLNCVTFLAEFALNYLKPSIFTLTIAVAASAKMAGSVEFSSFTNVL